MQCVRGVMHPFLASLSRHLKHAFLLLPLWILIFIIYIGIHSNNTPMTAGHHFHKHPHIHRQRKSPEPFGMLLQKDRTCDNLVNVTDGKIISECKDIAEKQKLYYSRNSVKVNPIQHTFLNKAAHICDKTTHVILLIHSLHDYSDRRQAIRETWAGSVSRGRWPVSLGVWAEASHLPEKVSFAFVLGMNRNSTLNDLVTREIETYGDIIQGDFFEDYHNMTRKSLLGLQWVKDYCKSAKFLIKSDDDMIINFPYMLEVLRTTNMSWGIMGPHNPSSRALRRGKWSLSLEEFPFYYFPPYESGAAYIISSDLIQPLLETSEYVPSIFIDDVYITGILAKILDARHVLQYGFAYWNSKRPKPCDLLRDDLLTATKMTPGFLKTLWAKLGKCKG